MIKKLFFASLLLIAASCLHADTVGGGAVHGTGPLNYLPLTGGTLNPVAGVGLQINGVANSWAGQFYGDATTNQSFGLAVRGGTSASDTALLVSDQGAATTFLRIRGDGESIFHGPVSSTRTCATNYTRYGTNLCMWTGTGQPSSTTTLASGCNVITLPAGTSATAKAYLVHTELSVKSTNAVGTKYATLTLFNNTACAGSIWPSPEGRAYEHVATAAGTLLTSEKGYVWVPNGTGPSASFSITAGNTGFLYIYGYID